MNPNMNNMTKAIIDFAGSLSGLPSTQINNTVKGVRAINSGQAEGFDAIKAPLFGFKGKIDD
nr:MAG TPA: crystallin beta/gamma motif-containing protein [Caudoviricetes sp.]